MLRKISTVGVRRPRLTLLVAAAITLLFSPLILHFSLDTDVTDLFPRSSRAAQTFAKFSHSFGSAQQLMILVEADDPERLIEFVDRYSAQLSRSPFVASERHRVTGQVARFLTEHEFLLLTDEEFSKVAAQLTPEGLKAQAHRLRALVTAPGGSSLAPLITADPLELLPKIRERISFGLKVDTTSGYFRSPDGRAAVIYVQPRKNAFDVEADRQLLGEASRLAAAEGAQITDGATIDTPTTGKKSYPLRVGFTGAAAYALAYRSFIDHDLSASTALSALAVLLLFAVFFRSLGILPLVAVSLTLGIFWTALLAVALYGQVNAVSLAFAAILLSIGIDLPIQLFNRLRQELAHSDPLVALQKTLSDLFVPAVAASLAPATVFFACALSDYRGLAQLGVLAGLGLLFNLLAMLTVFPALLALVPPRMWGRAQPASSQTLHSLGDTVARHPKLILIGALVVAAPGILFVPRVRFDQQLFSIQPQEMAPSKVQAELERRFGTQGKLLLSLIDDSDAEHARERSDQWFYKAEELRQRGVLAGYSSISALFPSKKTQDLRRDRFFALHPAEKSELFRAALVEAGFDPAPFAPFLDRLKQPIPAILEASAPELDFLVRSHVSNKGVATYFQPASTKDAEAITALQNFAAGPVGGEVSGTLILERSLRAIITHDVLKVSIAAALIVALLAALYSAFFYRRMRPFFAIMIPLAFAWIIFGSALALIPLPLNLFNMLTVPLCIGYGIDDIIFLLHRHQQDPRTAETLRTTGSAIVVTSLSTMAGFAALVVAHFSGLRLLGISGALAVAACLVATFALLPALLSLLWKPPN